MHSFRNDYSEGAHPKVLKTLTETNFQQTRGYGLDPRCQTARELIRTLCAAPEADVHFLVGGTQTNLLVIESMLKPYEAVISAHTGHVNVHETGAIEGTGHKVIAVPSPDGKLTPAMIESVPELHSDEHQVKPAMVYVSNTTEIGTVYSKAELQALRQCCDKHGLLLFLDGARLGSALACGDMDLPDYAALADVFYIGGTKNGALFGEALVFAKAREDGRQEGYAQGMAEASQESRQLREEQARRMEEEVHRFMEQAGVALDRQMDQSVADLRDLALAVAEKVVCVSLKSSGDVISRMIQTAIDKRKKKEWVHIYISECDAKRLTQIPASLSAALTALSDRVRLIPMSDDESGTCIIEMPDEIVDASAATQLNNLRTILMDTANSASGMNLFH